MRRIVRPIALVVQLAGLLMLLLLPTSRYEWVSDIDPTFDPSTFQDPSNDARLVATLVLALTLIAGAAAISAARSRWARVAVATPALLAGLVWLLRFL